MLLTQSFCDGQVPQIKRKDRAKAKYQGWRKPGEEPSWPPLAAEVTDLLRSTLLFDDPYDLVGCLEHFKRRFGRLCRVSNRFNNFSARMKKCVEARQSLVESTLSGPLFVNTNWKWEFKGRPIVVEIQLHLRGPYVSMKHLHTLYEVTWAQYKKCK